jgi:hypothetical protein
MTWDFPLIRPGKSRTTGPAVARVLVRPVMTHGGTDLETTIVASRAPPTRLFFGRCLKHPVELRTAAACSG